MTPVQVFPAPNPGAEFWLAEQAEGRRNSRKHEVLSGQPEVGAPQALLNAHLRAPFTL